MDYYDPDTTDHRIKTLLEKAQEKDNASKCWYCEKVSHNGTKRCSRCHYARYCDRNCQVSHWKTHKLSCEPVVLSRSNGHFMTYLFPEHKEDFSDFVCIKMHHKNGMSKNVTVNSLGELYEDSKQVHRSFQAPDDTRRTEFTALVQMPKPPQTDGPLLVQDIKRTIQSFVSFNEPGYGLLCQKITKNSTGEKRSAYFKCEFDSAFPGTVKIFASTCASSV